MLSPTSEVLEEGHPGLFCSSPMLLRRQLLFGPQLISAQAFRPTLSLVSEGKG